PSTTPPRISTRSLHDALPISKPVIDAYARACTLMGPAGAGQLTKMVNQICIAGLVQALSEGLNFAQRAGLDGEKVLDVISKGARSEEHTSELQSRENIVCRLL